MATPTTIHTTKLGRTIYVHPLPSGYVVLTMEVERYRTKERLCETLDEAKLMLDDWIRLN